MTKSALKSHTVGDLGVHALTALAEVSPLVRVAPAEDGAEELAVGAAVEPIDRQRERRELHRFVGDEAGPRRAHLRP